METKDEANARESVLVSSPTRGDLEAFNDLVLKYQDPIYNLTNAILGDPDSAEDAAQETFIGAFQYMGSFRGGSFRSWLLRIATNTCYDFLRTFRCHSTVALFPEDGDATKLSPRPGLPTRAPPPGRDRKR